VPGFTARQDTRTPVRFGIYSVIANLIFNAVLVLPLAHAGPALATTMAAYLNAGLLLIMLLRDKVYRPCRQWRLFLLRIVLAAGTMSAFLYRFVDAEQWLSWSASQRGLNLGLVVGLSIVVYALSLLLVGFRPGHLSGHQPSGT
ncbi:MAG: lipid II flippase MurJ, partial [Methylomonas sp.]